MLVTRGLGGYALVTAGLGDLGSYVEGVEYETPGEFHVRLYEEGLHRTRPRQAALRISQHELLKARQRGYGRTGG